MIFRNYLLKEHTKYFIITRLTTTTNLIVAENRLQDIFRIANRRVSKKPKCYNIIDVFCDSSNFIIKNYTMLSLKYKKTSINSSIYI